MVFLKDFFENVNFENNKKTTKFAELLFNLILYVPSTIFQLLGTGLPQG